MTFARATYLHLRHFVIYPVYRLLIRAYYFPYNLLSKLALGIAYMWFYLTHAPYIIRNAVDADYADEEAWDDFYKLIFIVSAIGYILFYFNHL